MDRGGRKPLTPIRTASVALILVGLLTWAYGGRSAILWWTGRFSAVTYGQIPPIGWSDFLSALGLAALGIASAAAGYVVTSQASRWVTPRAELESWVPKPSVTVAIPAGMAAASLLMLHWHVGITGVGATDVPTQLQGLLTYTRLLFFPLILCVLAAKSSDRWRLGVLALVAADCLVASATSGSRMVALFHALPILFLTYPRMARIGVFFSLLLVGINVATVGRTAWLPGISTDPNVIAEPGPAVEARSIADLATFPVNYIVDRTLGLPEMLVTVQHGTLCDNWLEGARQAFYAVVPFISGEGQCVGLRSVYGLPETFAGGLSLDLLGGYWALAGGYPLVFAVVSLLVGVAVGLSRVVGVWLELGLSLPFLSYVVFFLTLILLLDGRLAMALLFTCVSGLGCIVWWRSPKTHTSRAFTSE